MVVPVARRRTPPPGLLALCTLLAAALLPAPLASQAAHGTPPAAAVAAPIPLKAGDLIRFHVPWAAAQQSGLLAEVTADSLVFRSPGGAQPGVRMALADVREMQVLRERRTRLWQGLRLGALAGGVAGALFGWATDEEKECRPEEPASCQDSGAGFDALVFGLVGAAAGMTAGGIMGARHPVERWERVDLPPRAPAAPRLGVAVGRGGVILSLRLRR